MERLLKEGDYVYFLIQFEDGDFETSVDFNVFEVNSWDGETNEPIEHNLYLKGQIKFDGCSHIWFGDSDGYLHLCGKSYFEKHKRVMDAIWEMCSKKIKYFNKELAS